MSNDSGDTIKQFERKLKLCEQALSQNYSINKKYNDALNLLKQKEHFTSTVIESNKNAIIAINEKQIVTVFNQSAEKMFGYSKKEMLNKDSLQRIMSEHVFHKHLKAVTNFLATKKSGGIIDNHVELEGKRKDGMVFPIRVALAVATEKDGVIIVANIEDITLVKKAQKSLKDMNASLEQKSQELEKQYEYLQSIIDGMDDQIMVIKEDYSVELMNKSLKKSLKNIKIADPNNPKCYEISHHRTTPCDGSSHPCPLKEVFATKRHTTVVHNHDSVDGDHRYIELCASPLLGRDKNCMSMIESARDITEHITLQNDLMKQKEILYHQAHHDALTGLPNRVLFSDRLEQAIQTAKRNKTRVALLFIDLDRFKEINDSLGHALGDEVLKTVASRLKETLRAEDTIARLGGDEFTALIEGLKQAQDSSLVATKILNVLSKPMRVEGHILYMAGSIGISIYPDDGETTGELLKYADSALYKAKNEGRNNYQYYDYSMTKLALERVVMQTRLREALKKEQFVVYYQPQVNGITDKVIGMEALVRWQHPTMGLVPPDKFIPLAESTGLIVALDRAVMRTAMTQIARWYQDRLNPGKIAINLAVKQLYQEDFIEMLKNLMKETGCKAAWIVLEVTESQIMTHPDEAIKILAQISDLGIEIAVDDFGTGYSSLAYLKRLPIDKLKIDQAFVKDLPGDEEDSAITRAVIALAKTLKLKLIAEGVETKEQKDFLVKEGCINIQGYYYSKPIPADVFEAQFLGIKTP